MGENMALDGLLTLREPLGPIDQAYIKKDNDIEAILNEEVTPFNEAICRAPILLLGRKGSGKSAILAKFKIRATGQRHSNQSYSDILPEAGKPFLISIVAWREFHKLTDYVVQKSRQNTQYFDEELLFTEYLAELWEEAIWREIFFYFYNFCHHHESKQALAPVEKYVLADGGMITPSHLMSLVNNFFKDDIISGSPEVAAAKLFEIAKDAVLDYVEYRKSQIIILIDSMEGYPIRNIAFANVLGGLLRAINNVNHESRYLNVMFCLPEEIENHLQANSSNIMKDFSAAYRIKWKPIDLLAVTAHRYRLFVKIRDGAFYEQIKNLDLNSRDGIHDFFRMIMPEKFVNRLGDPEDPLAYVVRHTQLLPRHTIAIFNAIIARSFEGTEQVRTLSAAAIRDGVAEAEKLIADQVLVPYEKIYPDLISSCVDILPCLSPICTYDELRRVERRFKSRVEDDVLDIWRTLFEMGVIGKVTRFIQKDIPDYVRSTRYCLAQFHYNIDGSFGLSDNTEYCFHPVFSKYFGMNRKDKNDRKTVYPDNVDIIALR